MHRFIFSALAVVATVASFPAAAQSAGAGFNPKISLILDGKYTSYDADPENYEIPGIIMGPESELPAEGFAIGESELSFEANIDDKLRGWATIGFENEEGETAVELEEAYVATLALPAGLAAKFGRFYSDIGYQNRQHAHAWDFAEAPLAYRAFFAGQLGDDGVQLRWVAPTDLFVELGGELLRGDGFPAGGEDRSDVGAWTAFARAGGDLGSGGSWRAGVWHFDGDADDRRTGEDVETAFTGDSEVTGLDFVYKWAPNGNPAQRSFVLQAEYMFRSESGTVVHDPEGSADTSAYDGDQQGWYAQAVYQFVPRWRIGVRYDRLSADNDVDDPVAGTSLELLADDGEDPRRYSVMVDFSNSEYSRFRLQWNRDEARPGGESDDQLILQYTVSIGAHPAHQF
jgi:hypothetical protein